MPRSRLIPLIEAAFAVIVWGASFVATKIALRDISPAAIVWIRFAVGLLILGVAVALRGQFSIPAAREWGYLVLLGFLGIAFHQWLQSNALLTSEATTTAWIVATTPIFMAILGWLLLKESLDWVRTGGILLAALGVLLVVTHGDLAAISIGRFGAPGDVLILISSVNWTIFSIVSRRGLREHPAAWMMFWIMLSGWLITSAFFFAQSDLQELTQVTVPAWAALAFLGIFCSGFAYVAWYDALQALPAAQTGAFLYIEPLVAMAVAALLLGERINGASLLGGGVILLGVYLVNRE